MKNIRWVFTAAFMVACAFQASAQQNQLITNAPAGMQQIESDYHPDDLVAPASQATFPDKQEGIQTRDGRPHHHSSDRVPALVVPDEKNKTNNSPIIKPDHNKPR